MPKVGDRVIAKVGIDRYPQFMLPAGVEGTIEEISHGNIWIKMDDHYRVLDEWDNCVQVHETDMPGTFEAEFSIIDPN